MKKRAEKPIFTVKELRDIKKSNIDASELKEIVDEMKVWYFANLHLITNAEDYAFRNEINDLIRKLRIMI